MGTRADYNRRTLAGKPRVSSANLLIFSLVLVALSACSHRKYDLTRADAQENFGVQMAKQNLWREALFRFRRAVEINPDDAMAHNNLAVAYEANGDFENARKEYLEALRLDRSNQFIQKNYSRYVEFLSRNRKRQTKDVKTASTPDTTPATTTAPAPLETPVVAPASNPQPQPPPPVPPPTAPESL